MNLYNLSKIFYDYRKINKWPPDKKKALDNMLSQFHCSNIIPLGENTKDLFDKYNNFTDEFKQKLKEFGLDIPNENNEFLHPISEYYAVRDIIEGKRTKVIKGCCAMSANIDEFEVVDSEMRNNWHKLAHTSLQSTSNTLGYILSSTRATSQPKDLGEDGADLPPPPSPKTSAFILSMVPTPNRNGVSNNMSL